ncbi:phosphoinositide phospholipase C 4-like [Cynara cardunculus var. scolymus]|uniref:Phosphoinositide phospholipase C n=1 Tax=Cynara cardunculus var. scolymus TaxID=59895 RepID=A0A103Y700_CYNCS|nr:phosphoinositide phospholipase C 4-like [Cynara cardunculus var. scolymus]KVI03680.1 C2 calcium-dependent membrane targeting [Cynara cardunculus var. scolymus]
MGSYKVCCCFTRKFKVTEADPPSDVKEAFEKYCDGGIHMTADQLRRFIEECQSGDGEAVSISEAERLVEQVLHKRHPLALFINRKILTLEDFHHYLFNSELNPPIRSQVHQDMTAPLSHYFIYTGHNSYLTGNQLSSDCSEVPIIKALKRGVRVIELDLWPNSSKDNVHVLHGRTLTTPVELIRCLKSIKEHAFVASPYPVVITLEDHLTPDLQAKVAQMVTETFGEMLFCPESGKLKELPTPESLKYRILISTKPPKEYLEAEEDQRTKSQRVKDADDDDVWGEEPSKAIAYKDKNDKDESDESDHDHDTEESEDRGKKSVSCPAYKSLIAIHAGKPKGGLEEALKVEKDKVRRLSLSEQALEKAAERHQQHIVRFTQKNILRIYPKGTRFTSSNYKPLIGWLHGAQMVAFNMQGYGRSLWLMHGMFRANGGCGYVKKPDFLMTTGPNNEVFDPKAKLQVKKTLKVKIYMGDGWHLDFKQTHFDTYSPPDFYTRVGISGAPADEIMRKTKPKEDNWTPVWNEEFSFPLTLPEIALLRIEVHEYDMSEKDDFAGQICLPVSELRPGIRAVPLCNRKGDPYTASRLLVRFEFV